MFSYIKDKIIETKKRGFTFIETLVAITVLLVSVVAPMTLAQQGITAARLAQDQIVAFYLAQEGVELVRNLRDENIYRGQAMLDNPLDDCIVIPANPVQAGCTIDATEIGSGTFDIFDCPNGGCPAIKKNDDVYGHAAGMTDTKYTREIRVWYANPTSPDPDPEAIVEVIVTWPFITSTREYVLRNNLLAW